MLALTGIAVKAKIHESETSVVYRGIQEDEQLPVILKVLKSEYPSLAELNRYKQEYEITQRLTDEGAIKVYQLKNYRNTLVMVLEDFGGEALKLFMAANQFSLKNAVSLVIRITKILEKVHAANIIHKDINPCNIVYNPQTDRLKLIDFGLATVCCGDLPLQNTNLIEGTLAYMSPEQTGRTNRALDYRTDFYSLGVTFYELITHRLPFVTKDPMEWVHFHLAKQPVPPHEINPEIPRFISDIVMKLMAKNAEDRYQSERGILADLESCLAQLEQPLQMVLGKDDSVGQLKIPQKLYGRERSRQTLIDTFERVIDNASKEMMLVYGYSGVGKSALVREMSQPVLEKQGYFIAGKFEQFQRNIPYSAIASAFQGLVRQLLAESESQLQQWRTKILAALGEQIKLIIDLIPEVELIVGKQLFSSDGGTNSPAWFNLALQKFIRVFGCEHPLVIFLDDLQWADRATIGLIELILTDAEIGSLLIIGTYRKDEVNASHPLMLAVKELRKKSVRVNRMNLASLGIEPVTQMIADSLDSSITTVKPLAKLLLQKSGGNPLFIKELLPTLWQEKLIAFDRSMSPPQWTWNLEQIEAIALANNAIELMIRKFNQLPHSCQKTLCLAACIGNEFDLDNLLIVGNFSQPEDVVRDLAIAVEWGLIQRSSNRQDYKFSHDRVQQAAYESLKSEKAALHLQIGRLLLSNIAPDLLGEKIFELVGHFERGIKLLTDQTERDRIAQLNLIAGQKALASAAYEAAMKYLNLALELLAADTWQQNYDLTLAIYESAAEAAYLNGNFKWQNQLTAKVLKSAKNPLDKVKVYEVKIQACVAQTKFQTAIKIVLKSLAQLGIAIPAQVSELDIEHALGETAAKLAGKQIFDLIELPSMSDPTILAAMRLLLSGNAPAYVGMPQLLPLLVAKQVNLSIEYGNADVSPLAYAFYGAILCDSIISIESGYQFGQVALKLLENSENKQIRARTLDLIYGMIQGWKVHLKETLKPLESAYQMAKDNGTFEYAGYSILKQCYYSFLTGQPLKELDEKLNYYIQVLSQLNQQTAVNYLQRDRQAILNLIEDSPLPGILTGQAYNEWEKLRIYHQSNDHYGLLYLYLNKLILSYLFGEYLQAIAAANRATSYTDGGTGLALIAVLCFYDSLARLMVYPESDTGAKIEILETVNYNQKKLKFWAKNAPMNYQHKYELVEAERYRIAGKYLEAMDYYDSAIANARTHEYIQEEALSNELAAKFYLGLGKEKIAQVYLKDAHYCYQRWGAMAKVKELETQYPILSTSAIARQTHHSITHKNLTSNSVSEALDLATVIKASQAISGEILLDKLLAKFMTILIENAGAQTGYLLLRYPNEWGREGELRIEASGSVAENSVAVLQSIPIENHLPVSLINYVSRTQEIVVENDAARTGNFTADPYIITNQSKSILCAPIADRGRFSGIVYLENNLTTGAFTSDRLKIINIITSQAAISIENARLYSNLEQTKQQLEDYSHTLELKVEARTQELATAKKAAETANNSKSEFLSNMSHELRTPLNGILGYAQILQRDNCLNPKQKEGINIIHQCGNHLLTLINDLLDLSKIEAGKMELSLGEIYFSSFLQGVVEICRIRAEQKDLAFIYEPSNQLPSGIYADEKRLRQVLINLLGNAIKFTSTGGVTFKVEVVESGGVGEWESGGVGEWGKNAVSDPTANREKIRFEIEDTGIGMSAEQLANIFLPFERVGEKARLIEGTGLGLSISQKIINLMDGQIQVTSKPGEGSRFWFELDLPILHGMESAIATGETGKIIGYQGDRRQILVVDDKWQNRAVLVNFLELIGFQVTEAVDGKEGLEKAIALHPDLIIIDLVMPVLDGFEMIRQLRQLNIQIPAIACSASVYAIDKQKSIQAGSNDFLSKPVVGEILLEKLQTHLGLEWIYEPKNLATQAEINQPQPADSLIFPPPETLANLYDLVRQGLVFQIEESASHLEQENAAFAPFMRKIIEYTQEFELEKIIELIEPAINPAPPGER